MTELLNVKQMAGELGVSIDQAKKLIFSGQIPAVDVGVAGRSFWRVSRDDLNGWLDRQRAATAQRFGGGAA